MTCPHRACLDLRTVRRNLGLPRRRSERLFLHRSNMCRPRTDNERTEGDVGIRRRARRDMTFTIVSAVR